MHLHGGKHLDPGSVRWGEKIVEKKRDHSPPGKQAMPSEEWSRLALWTLMVGGVFVVGAMP